MLADIPPTPTFAADYLYLGLPLGLAVGAAILALAIVAGRALRLRGKGRGAALAAGVALFVALDLAVFFVWSTWLRAPNYRPLPPELVPVAGSPGQAR